MKPFEGTFESLQTRELPQWFEDAKFGIFIHWYPASVPAYAPLSEDLFEQTTKYGEETAFRESPYAEWYVNSLAIEGSSVQKHHAEVYGDKPYDEFVTEFFTESQQWDPSAWQELFQASGAKYCVMGTRHIDGAIMWPTSVHNPIKGPAYTSPRDLVGEACEAARNAGMRIGLYYCGGLDVTFQGLGYNGWLSMFLATPQTDEYAEYATAHYRELIQRYSPDLLWNDVGWPGGGAAAMQFMAEYFNHNPDGVVNDRFDMIGVATGTTHADYITPEYSSGLTLPDKKFEVCRGIGRSFGYNALDDDSTYASSEELIQLLINAVADGGNLLLNIGPTANGEVPELQQQRIRDIGAWLNIYGAAIFNTCPHSVSSLTSSDGRTVRLTQDRNGIVYAIIIGNSPHASITIEGLPQGDIMLLGHTRPLVRDGNTVSLPLAPRADIAFALRIAQ
ncbi:MAG: alpha-L-fucosidase [Actinobacteria bacterium]|uniref:alpha-L-fucosidase n=2 Tax=freshwater metagenome TaxID=449393 RepID=A0A6J7T8R6_9ZZZZ|nr:alpha-L-fucosidase [Actinomycetota bacterium]